MLPLSAQEISKSNSSTDHTENRIVHELSHVVAELRELDQPRIDGLVELAASMGLSGERAQELAANILNKYLEVAEVQGLEISIVTEEIEHDAALEPNGRPFLVSWNHAPPRHRWRWILS